MGRMGVLQVAHCGIGDMNENDIEMAAVVGSTVVLYNVRMPAALKRQAAQRGIRVCQGNVLHELIAEAIGAEATEGVPSLRASSQCHDSSDLHRDSRA